MHRWIIAGLATLAAFSAYPQRLERSVFPEHYTLTFTPDLATESFQGEETLEVSVQKPLREIVLNSKALKIDSALVDSQGQSQTAAVKYDQDAETATLTVPRELPAGPASLRLHFGAKLGTRLRGFYLGHANGRKYASTQFESISAREAFPSFDEPSMKATFAISIVADAGDVAFSNGTQIADTPGPEKGKHTLRFATTPRMSPYLVAMVVGDFKCSEGEVDGIPLRVCATPDKLALTGFALEGTKHFVKAYDTYFGIRYPFTKLDQIAIPDFEAGAMENTALITYRESFLLVDPRVAPAAVQRHIAETVAHEIAHQWFGDLVTLGWWDDVWLNEGFATWAQKWPVQEWQPGWYDAVSGPASLNRPMTLDSLHTSRAIHTRVDSTKDLDRLFDALSYQKAAAILEMLQSFDGSDAFRDGVRKYLHQNQYGNTTSADFASALSEDSSKPVDAILHSFVYNAGLPLISVRQSCGSDGKGWLDVSQERFFADGGSGAGKATDAPLWNVPVCWSGVGGEQCRVLSQRSQRFDVDGCEPLVVNGSGTGYYVTSYDPADLNKLAISGKLDAASRYVILRDEWNLARAGRFDIGDYLSLPDKLAAGQDPAAMQLVLNAIEAIDLTLVSDHDRPRFQQWVRDLLTPLAQQLGWKRREGESDRTTSLRPDVLQTLGDIGHDTTVLREALRLVESDPSKIDPTVAGTAFHLAALTGGEKLYQRDLTALEAAHTPLEHGRYLGAILSFRDPALVSRTLDYLMGPKTRSQDAGALGGYLGDPRTRPIAWKFITEHWDAIGKRLAPEQMVQLVASLAGACDPAVIDQLQGVLVRHPQPLISSYIGILREANTNCVAFRHRQQPSFENWLAARKVGEVAPAAY
jgi:aminopeptidase N